MSKKSFEVNANANVIKWIRENDGWSVEEVSKKLKTSVDNYLKIESGEKKPTLKQLETLAKIFKRPLTVFFLTQVPNELPYASSFRILPESEKEFSKDLRLVIRKARYYQSLANEILIDLGLNPASKIIHRSLEDNPIEVAKEERELSGISIRKQISWKNFYEAFNFWRSFIEDKNIFILQFNFPLEDARGFTLMEKEPPIIVLNSSDNISARIFTLFHEYAHILLGITEIYTDNEILSNKKIEKWCDSFASEFLIPDDELILQVGENNINQQIIDDLSNNFKVSKKAILVKLRNFGLIDEEEYRKLFKSLEISTKKQGGFITPYRKSIMEKGSRFISYILEAKNRGILTTHDALDYLGIKYNQLAKLEEELSKY